jgi:hypothetical protein
LVYFHIPSSIIANTHSHIFAVCAGVKVIRSSISRSRGNLLFIAMYLLLLKFTGRTDRMAVLVSSSCIPDQKHLVLGL